MTVIWLIRDVRRDAALALRQLAGRPGFAVAALLTLGLGIGAPTAIFSVVHAVLLKPLPYVDADRIVQFSMESQSPRGRVIFDAVPASEALRWADTSGTLSALALFNETARTLTTPEGPVRLTGLSATPNLFAVLGTAPAVGRTFDPASREVRQVVLSHAAWRRYFQASEAVVGTSITLDGASVTVTGVMPAGFAFPTTDTAFWVPQLLDAGGGRGLLLPAIATVRPGTAIDAVQAEGARVLEEGADARDRSRLIVRTLHDQMVGGYRRVLWVLMAAVSLVSVIATVNIALLLLTRGAGRAQEFSVRLALGASRGRLARQLFTEGSTLALLGGATGLLCARLALDALIRIAPPDLPRLEDAGLHPQVLAFTVALVVLATLVFGVLSAVRPRVPRRRLNVLASAELALTAVLLVGAGLLLRSFVGLVLIDQGFAPGTTLVAQVTLPQSRYAGPEARLAFHERLLDRTRVMPGVAHAGLSTSMPNRQPTGRFAYDPLGIDMFADPFTLKVAGVRMVTTGFLEAMGIPLLAGRTFSDEDTVGSEPVIVVSRSLAHAHFADTDAVGRLLYSQSGNRRVIGVVEDVRPATDNGTAVPAAYLPLRQSSDVLSWAATITVAIRGSAVLPGADVLRATVQSLDPEMPLFNVRSLEQEVAGLVAGPRFSATALGLFALVAVVMAAIGVYGVMAYSAAQRTREIGVRMALGASANQVLRLILRDGLYVVSAGLIVGLCASLWLAQMLTGLLHEVTPADPVALLAVALLLTAIGLVATLVPARRATRVSALVALRHD